MKLTTGLEIRVKHLRVQGRNSVQTSIAHVDLDYMLPMTVQEIWVVELAAPRDSEQHYKGEVIHVMLLSKEPRITLEGATYSIYPGQPEEKQDLMVRRRHSIPDDCVPYVEQDSARAAVRKEYRWSILETS